MEYQILDAMRHINEQDDSFEEVNCDECDAEGWVYVDEEATVRACCPKCKGETTVFI